MLLRHARSHLLDALSDTPVVLVQGARQTGKTTLVRALAADDRPARYVTLDDAATVAAASHDPQQFLAGHPGAITVDEVQKVPELLPAIKIIVDRDRRPGRFLLTGSARVMTVPSVSESLAGRIELLTLWPLSQGEIEGARETFVDWLFSREPLHEQPEPLLRPALLTRLAMGGFPEVVTLRRGPRRADWFASYVSTMIQRDIRDLANLEAFSDMARLLWLLASRAGGLVNYAQISRDLAIPQTTLKRYLSLLQMTFLVQLLPPWSGNLGLRLVKSPKLYLVDTGLLAHLVGLDEEGLAKHPDAMGPLFENFVVMELRKQCSWSRNRAELYHFRTHAGREVDIVLENRARDLAGVEVKASSTLKSEDFAGLRALAELAQGRFRRGVILYLGQEVIPFGADLVALPIQLLWQTTQHIPIGA